MRHRQSRWLFAIVLMGGLAAFSLLWFEEHRDGEDAEPTFGGTYIEGVAGAPSRLNPLFARQNSVDEALVALIFAGLTRLDGEGRAVPDLAESWSASPDGLSYTFLLRPDLVWHDGAPLTAEDVVFTFELLRAPGLRPPASLEAALSEVEVSRLDERRVRFALPRPFAPLPSYLTLGVLPAHILGNTSPSMLADDPFNHQPVGAGPYRLEELSAERAVLAANPAHHRGQPFIQRLELHFFRNDRLLLAALDGKEVHGGLFYAGLGPGEIHELEQRDDLRMVSLPSGETTYIYFNLRLPLFQDRRVRQALLMALDRDLIITEVFEGQALRADSPVSAGTWAYTDSVQRYGAEPDAARAMLSEAGWLPGASGMRARAGVPLSFTLAVNNDPVRVTVANKVAASWREIGVEVTVEASGATTIVRDMLEPRSFESVLFAHVVHDDPDPYLTWHSSQAGPRGANVASLQDERIDETLETAREADTNELRSELYAKFQGLFAQEVPALPLYTSTALYVQRKEVRGAHPGYLDNPGSRFWQVHEWYVRTR